MPSRPGFSHRQLMGAVALSWLLVACDGNKPSQPQPQPPPTPVSCGHAHNDYEHPRPLFDALDAGMCSVEVDIFVVAGELLVAHSMTETDPSRTLQSLYLDPLRNGATTEPLFMLIDIKSEATPSYAALHQVLAGYSDILTQWEGGVKTQRLVTAIISGQRDRAAMEAQALRYAGLDGRLPDLQAATAAADLMPLVSANWALSIAFHNDITTPAEQRELLSDYRSQAHTQGRMLRFWNTPDDESSWALQKETSVDLINTDKLTALQSFLNQ